MWPAAHPELVFNLLIVFGFAIKVKICRCILFYKRNIILLEFFGSFTHLDINRICEQHRIFSMLEEFLTNESYFDTLKPYTTTFENLDNQFKAHQ